MQKEHFTEEQIAYALAQGSSGQSIAETCRRFGQFEWHRDGYRTVRTIGLPSHARLTGSLSSVHPF